MIRLNQWTGSFDAGEHRYFRKDGKELQGVTGMLKAMLFKDEYRGVSKEILQNAADRGHLIHSRIELFDNSGLGDDMPEVLSYARLKKMSGLEHIASEFLVSDDENYASAIDKVYHEDGAPEDEVVLGDIKTTYSFNRDYVSWQLSVYAYFFEMMNPGLKVGRLIGLWIRNDRTRGMIAKVIDVERKPAEVVRELIRCAVEGCEFKVERMPSYISENLDRLVWITETMNALSAEKDAIAKDILEHMQEDRRDKVDAGVMLFTKKAGAVTNRFDTKLFKEEHSDLYEKYTKQTVGQETLQIKLRDTENNN